MHAMQSCISLPYRTSPKSVVAKAFSPATARTRGPIAHTMRAGQADAAEYPRTPSHERRGFAPISVEPYTTQAPMPDAKKDRAMDLRARVGVERGGWGVFL